MKEGYDELWLWFGFSRASWLTMPRVLMHEMPDEWQFKMAELLFEWDEAWDYDDCDYITVTLKKNGKFVKMPESLKNYRHPDKSELGKFRR